MISPRVLDLTDNLFEPGEEVDDTGGGESDECFKDEGPSQGFLALVGNTKAKIERRKAKPKTVAAAVFNRALAEVDEMLRTGEWEPATAKHLVALYDRLHQRCYGVEPVELGPTERFNAGLLAGGMLKRHFDGDTTAMVSYMLWAWERELGVEKWRRETGRDGRRIGVRLMFSGAMLTDYRLHLARTGRRA